MNERDPAWNVINQESDQLVNLSHCQIGRLNVYRGQENIVEINHLGFLLTERGTIEVGRQLH